MYLFGATLDAEGGVSGAVPGSITGQVCPRPPSRHYQVTGATVHSGGAVCNVLLVLCCLLLQRRGAIRVQCASGGAVWVSHLKKKDQGSFKLPATSVLSPEALAEVPHLPDPALFLRHGTSPSTFQEVWVTVDGGVAYVHSDFYNGAMSTEQCEHLTSALKAVEARPDVKVCTTASGYPICPTFRGLY